MPKINHPPRRVGAKKQYAKPQLVSYGDIREVTQAIPFGSGAQDNPNPIFKTSPMV